MDLPRNPDGYRQVWPFRRSWVAIAILVVMDIVFLIPAVLTFRDVVGEWGSFDSLFDLVVIYDVPKMRNLRIEQPQKKSGTSWRGKHFVFDYGANSVSFGSDINPGDLPEIKTGIQMVSGTAIRSGEAWL